MLRAPTAHALLYRILASISTTTSACDLAQATNASSSFNLLARTLSGAGRSGNLPLRFSITVDGMMFTDTMQQQTQTFLAGK